MKPSSKPSREYSNAVLSNGSRLLLVMSNDRDEISPESSISSWNKVDLTRGLPAE